jgi:hypothetical protein
LFELKIGSKVFAKSKLQIPLIKAIKEAKKSCEKFSESQNIHGCKISKTIATPRPNAEMEVNGQFKNPLINQKQVRSTISTLIRAGKSII